MSFLKHLVNIEKEKIKLEPGFIPSEGMAQLLLNDKPIHQGMESDIFCLYYVILDDITLESGIFTGEQIGRMKTVQKDLVSTWNHNNENILKVKLI